MVNLRLLRDCSSRTPRCDHVQLPQLSRSGPASEGGPCSPAVPPDQLCLVIIGNGSEMVGFSRLVPKVSRAEAAVLVGAE